MPTDREQWQCPSCQPCQPCLIHLHSHPSISKDLGSHGRVGHPLPWVPNPSRSQELGRVQILGQSVLLQLRPGSQLKAAGGRRMLLSSYLHGYQKAPLRVGTVPTHPLVRYPYIGHNLHNWPWPQWGRGNDCLFWKTHPVPLCRPAFAPRGSSFEQQRGQALVEDCLKSGPSLVAFGLVSPVPRLSLPAAGVLTSVAAMS